MKKLPKISIVTPSFNQAEFIERTIVSVLSQSYPNKEYIIMDGGSSDGSVEIIRKYENSLEYWQSTPDGGQTSAVCKGFERATGDILLYLNSDDMLLPGALWAYATALGGKDKAWAIGRLEVVDEQDRMLAYRPVYPFGMGDIWHNLYIVHQEGTCFTRALYEEVGGFDSSYHYAMDFHMWLRMRSLLAPTLIRQFTAAFRVSSGQKSADGCCYAQEVGRVFEDVRKWRIARGLPEFPRRPLMRGLGFSMAKLLYYFWVCGFDVAKSMLGFRLEKNGNAMSRSPIVTNKR